jgi:hypothetical protein
MHVIPSRGDGLLLLRILESRVDTLATMLYDALMTKSEHLTETEIDAYCESELSTTDLASRYASIEQALANGDFPCWIIGDVHAEMTDIEEALR